jgi:hypothetical protein
MRRRLAAGGLNFGNHALQLPGANIHARVFRQCSPEHDEALLFRFQGFDIAPLNIAKRQTKEARRNNMFNSAGVIPFAAQFRSTAKRQARRPIAHGQLSFVRTFSLLLRGS